MAFGDPENGGLVVPGLVDDLRERNGRLRASIDELAGLDTPPEGEHWADQIAIAKDWGFYLELKSPFTPGGDWIAGFTPHGCTGWNGTPDIVATGPCMATAIGAAFVELRQDYGSDELAGGAA